jgi:hypothetical protein
VQVDLALKGLDSGRPNHTAGNHPNSLDLWIVRGHESAPRLSQDLLVRLLAER